MHFKFSLMLNRIGLSGLRGPVTGTDINNCSNTASISVMVNPLPQPVILQLSNSLVCTNVTNCSYVWTYSGNIIDTAVSIPITFVGTYKVVVTNSLGCTGSDTVQVFSLSAANVSTDDHLISIYPNPTNGLLTIRYTLLYDEHVSIQLSDMSGRTVRDLKRKEKQAKGTHTLTMDMNTFNLSDGLYMVRFSNDEGSVVRKIEFRKKQMEIPKSKISNSKKEARNPKVKIRKEKIPIVYCIPDI